MNTADPLIKHKSSAVVSTGASAGDNESMKALMGGLDMTRLFPGLDGIPFRANKHDLAPMLKKDDPDFMQPKTTADAHARMFNMSKENDMRAYNEIWDKAAKGTILISVEERHWSEKEQTFLIFLRWGELFLELSKEGANAHRSFK